MGTYTTTAGIDHAFLWQDGVATDLGTLPGDVFADGNGINNEGQVVGQSCSTSGCKAFLWQNDVMTDLNALAADSSLLMDPFAINARGQIVGVALQKTTGEAHAFLATPCNDEEENDKDCEDQSMSNSHDETRQVPKFVVPENPRKLLRGRVGFPYPGFGSRSPQ